MCVCSPLKASLRVTRAIASILLYAANVYTCVYMQEHVDLNPHIVRGANVLVWELRAITAACACRTNSSPTLESTGFGLLQDVYSYACSIK